MGMIAEKDEAVVSKRTLEMLNASMEHMAKGEAGPVLDLDDLDAGDDTEECREATI